MAFEEIKRWLRAIGVPLLLVLFGFGVGFAVRGHIRPSGRFQDNRVRENPLILDSKTGQLCRAEPDELAAQENLYSEFPRCIDLYRKF